MLFANVMFMIGSAIAGWATSMNMLIVRRGVAGIGAGGLMGMVVNGPNTLVCEQKR